MIGDLEYRVAELERRLRNVIAIGTIKEVSPKNAKARIKVGGIVTDWLPWITHRAGKDKTFWSPHLQEQVVVLSPGGSFETGVILPAIYQNRFPAPEDTEDIHHVEYEDGATFTYDKKKHFLKAEIPGDVEVNADGFIKAIAKKGIEHDGNASKQSLGNVNGHCLCPFSNTKHIQVSGSVKSSK